MKNETDYVFPDGWGLKTPEQKDRWFKQERAYRQAMQQDTAWGQMARDHSADSDYKVDEDLR